MTPADRTAIERVVDAIQILVPSLQRLVSLDTEQRNELTTALMAARRIDAAVQELKPGPGDPRRI